MTSPIPGAIAWPLLLFILAVAAGRRLLVADTQIDWLINRALTWALIGLLIRESSIQTQAARILPFDDANLINAMRQASFGFILLTVACIYGIAKAWSGSDTSTVRQRQWIYDGVAVVATAVILVAGTPARNLNLLLDQALGWETVVAWSAFYAPLAVTSALIGRVFVAELRAKDVTRREAALYVGVLALAAAIGLDSVATPIVTLFEVISGSESKDPEMTLKALTFFGATTGAAIVSSVPLISVLLASAKLDRTGRYCRRLQPLWKDLTATVPEIVLHRSSGPHSSATRLHRMIIEIRDSLLHLKKFAPNSVTFDDSIDTGTYAYEIARAIQNKHGGAQPSRVQAHKPLRVGARDLTAELNQLLAIAGAWPAARRRAALSPPKSVSISSQGHS
ncbi:hypothetical protein JGU71_28900 [Antrihabitans sp. YC3-6]|uniref:DUF6545 domain-containing protein n=1 Tax=Antrihabitans stalagmiti TaxID=2799499 RepID=A0A934U6V4_9NOCA|nr:MAB_1171c family putative transporter [Antrihabitans stalagmiti]MBJ8342916.1 hypothetical protein [Antrihabitans stalagmiti]